MERGEYAVGGLGWGWCGKGEVGGVCGAVQAPQFWWGEMRWDR